MLFLVAGILSWLGAILSVVCVHKTGYESKQIPLLITGVICIMIAMGLHAIVFMMERKERIIILYC